MIFFLKIHWVGFSANIFSTNEANSLIGKHTKAKKRKTLIGARSCSSMFINQQYCRGNHNMYRALNGSVHFRIKNLPKFSYQHMATNGFIMKKQIIPKINLCFNIFKYGVVLKGYKRFFMLNHGINKDFRGCLTKNSDLHCLNKQMPNQNENKKLFYSGSCRNSRYWKSMYPSFPWHEIRLDQNMDRFDSVFVWMRVWKPRKWTMKNQLDQRPWNYILLRFKCIEWYNVHFCGTIQ